MLRYAPPIYTVIIMGIIFVFIIILITVFYSLLFFFIPLLVMYTYSRLRIYCLIHTPLSPLSVCQPPRRGTVRHPYPSPSEIHPF
jgi:hypothetical protein